MSLDLSPELDAGNTDNFQSSTKSKNHQDSTKLELLDSRPSKVTLSTELESEEEEEREQSTRVPFMVNQSIKVLENSRKPDPTDLLLKRRLEEDAATLEFLTHTGLDKTPPTNSLKLSALTQHTKLSSKTQELTGLSQKSTTKEN
jgi:hypothetical protein